VWLLYWRTPAYAPARRKRHIPEIVQLPLFGLSLERMKSAMQLIYATTSI
jgi:hypothetical protein